MNRRVLALVLLLTVPADARHPIPRSRVQRNAFQHKHPCPSTHKTYGACPGYVVDHVIALECDGPDSPKNMQWQTIADGRAKDKTERNCHIERK